LLRKQRKTLGGYYILPHPVQSAPVIKESYVGAIRKFVVSKTSLPLLQV